MKTEKTFLYGLDIGGTKIEFAVFDHHLKLLHSERIATPQHDYSQWLQAIIGLVEKADQRFQCVGHVGMGIPGFIHPHTQLAEITNIRVADNRPIAQDLARGLNRPIRIENDANCFALSESFAIKNQSVNMMLGLILGTGFGGGIICNGKIHSGQTGMAGEFGHVKLNYLALKRLGWDNAPIYACGCGNQACLDTYMSGRGFEYLYRDFYGRSLTAQQIIQQFLEKEKSAVEFVELFSELTAICFADIITQFDPDVVVLGGGLSNFDYLYHILPIRLPHYLMRSAKIPLIQKAKYGDSGGVRGAAALWIEHQPHQQDYNKSVLNKSNGDNIG